MYLKQYHDVQISNSGVWRIRHIYIKPATPRLNGKVERSHRIDAEEFYRQLKGVLIDDAQLFNDKLHQSDPSYQRASS
jgi:hypothetical protein